MVVENVQQTLTVVQELLLVLVVLQEKYHRPGPLQGDLVNPVIDKILWDIEYGIFGEGSQISTYQNRESEVISILIKWKGKQNKLLPVNLNCIK